LQTAHDILAGKLLVIIMKWHSGFPLVPKLVTLNDLTWRNGRYVALFHRIRYFWGQLTSHW